MTFIGSALKPNLIAQPHDTTFNPVALWQFNEDLTDSSGNGLTLDLNTGTESYIKILTDFVGFHFDGSTGLDRNGVNDTELTITGDLTIEAIIFHFSLSGITNLMTFGSTSTGTEANNILWSFSVLGGGAYDYIAEEGAGTDITATLDNRAPVRRPYHFAVVRENNDLTYYIDGEIHGTPTSGLNAPTGGTSCEINVWQNRSKVASAGRGAMASLKIIDAALTADQVKSEYNRTLGPVFGNK